MSGCCDTTAPGQAGRPLSVTDCFSRGLKTRRLAPLQAEGARVSGDTGLWAAFSLQGDAAGTLTQVRFTCASCTTLIACCQALADLSRCRPRADAVALDAPRLLARLPGIPLQKQDRAHLAARAFAQALQALRTETPAPARTPIPSLSLQDRHP